MIVRYAAPDLAFPRCVCVVRLAQAGAVSLPGDRATADALYLSACRRISGILRSSKSSAMSIMPHRMSRNTEWGARVRIRPSTTAKVAAGATVSPDNTSDLQLDRPSAFCRAAPWSTVCGL